MENTFKGSKDYVASPELMNAVNIAVALKKAAAHQGRARHGQDDARAGGVRGDGQETYHLER